MKKYELTIIENGTEMNVYRKNNGFSIIELIGLIETIKQDLMLQYLSMVNHPSKITREYIAGSSSGKIIIEDN